MRACVTVVAAAATACSVTASTGMLHLAAVHALLAVVGAMHPPTSCTQHMCKSAQAGSPPASKGVRPLGSPLAHDMWGRPPGRLLLMANPGGGLQGRWMTSQVCPQ
jgi:hypothetical protein